MKGKPPYRVVPVSGGLYPNAAGRTLDEAKARALRLVKRFGARFDICLVEAPTYRWKLIERVAP